MIKLIRRGLVAAAAVTTVALSLLGAAHLPVVRAQAFDWARAQAAQRFGIVVEADAVAYNLLTTSVTLRQARLATPGQPPFLRAESLHVVLDRDVLWGTVSIQHLDLVRPSVSIVRHRDGTTNLPISKSDPASPSSPIRLGIVDVRSFSVDINDEIGGQLLTAGPIDLTINASTAFARPGAFGPGAFKVRLPTAGTAARTRSLSGTIAGRVGFDGSRLSLPEFTVEAPEGRLALSGSIDLLAEVMNVEARGQLELDLPRASRLVSVPDPALSGSARVQFEVTGSATDPVVRVDAAARNLGYRSIAGASLSAAATYAAGRLDVASLDVASSLGAAHANGALMLSSTAAPPATSRIRARITDVHLDALLDAARVALPVRLGTSASGDVDVSLEGGEPFGEGWQQRAVAQATVRMTPSGAGLSVGGELNAHLDHASWSVGHAVRSTTGQASLSGQVAGRLSVGRLQAIDSTLSGRSRLQVERLGTLVPLLQRAGIGVPPPIDDRIGGSLDAQLEPRGTIGSPQLVATVRGRAIQLGDFPAGDLHAVVAVDREKVRAQTLNAQLGSARLAASGTFAWNGNADAQFDATSDDLGALARRFDPGSVTVTGSARFEGSVQGTVESPRGRGTLSMRRLTVDGTPVGALTATLGLADTQLNVDARAANLNAQLRGVLDTREPFAYRANATLDRTSIPALLSASLRQSTAITEATVSATARAQGVLRRPLESTAEITVGALDAVVSAVPVHLDAPATVAVERDSVTATPIQLRAGTETYVRVQGTLARDTSDRGVDVHLDSTVPALVELASSSLPDERLAADASHVTLDVHVGGTISAPEPTGTISLRAEAIRYADLPPVTDLTLDGRIERTQISMESLAATWQNATLHATGSVPLRMIVPDAASGDSAGAFARWRSTWLASLPGEQKPATLSARVTGISRDVLVPFVEPSQLQEVAGTVAVTLTAGAEAFAIDRVRASAVLDEAALVIAGVPVSQTTPTRIRLENGTARIENLRWNAQGNELIASGGALVAGEHPTVDVAIVGDIDLRIPGAFVRGVASGGVGYADLSIKGPLAAPAFAGSVGITAGELRIDSPPVAASDFDGTLWIDADSNATVSLNGLINGGAATIVGGLDLKDRHDPRGRVSLTARSVMLDYPDGFQTASNADLVLTIAGPGSTLAGRIDLLNGTYREPIVLSRGLLRGLGGSDAVTPATASPFLANLRLDIAVASAEAVRIDNNYGRLNLTVALNVSGTAVRPGATGRIEALPDGRIYLAGNTYQVHTLAVDLANPAAIEPDLTFLAETRVSDVAMEVALQCAASGACERDVRSQTTGKTDAEAEALLFGVSTDPAQAGAQLARLLSGEVLGIVGRTVGLDTLRLEAGAGRADLFDDPSLVAGDVNPASRLTFGKRLGERVELAYSQDLAQNGFTTSTSYFAPAGISFRALLLDDQSRSYEFRHEPRFGAPRRPPMRPVPQPSIAAVHIGGTTGFTEKELRGLLRLTEGRRFDFVTWQDDRARLTAFYRDRGFFEARVRARRLTADAAKATPDSIIDTAAIVLDYTIDRGRPTRLEVSGIQLPSGVRDRIVERWTGAIFDGFLERDATLIVREHLYTGGWLQAKVAAAMTRDAAGDGKTLRIDVEPGAMLTPRLQFEGNALVATPRLQAAAQASGSLTAWLDPAIFTLVIDRVYREEGLLSAEIAVLPPETRDAASFVRVVIREGEPWRIGRLAVEGADRLPNPEAAEHLDLPAGSRYEPRVVAARVDALEQRFRAAGFLDARVTAETVLNQHDRTADVRVVAAPGRRSVLSSVAIDGAPAESPLIARSVNFVVGMPVDSTAISDARRRLYETGVYRRVDINLEPADVAADTDTGADRQVVARVHVEERPRYAFRYGLQVLDDVVGVDERSQQVGFSADLENRNLLGLGATVGVSARLRPDQQIGRVFIGANRFFGLPLRSNLFVSRERQQIGSAPDFQTLADITEISAEQTYRLRRFIDLRYGYGYGRNRTIAGSDFDLTVKVARLTTSAIIDRRSDPFDPARGWFASTSLEVSRPGLGSDLSFLKSYLQYFRFIPLGDKVLLASAARVGLARTYRDEDLIPNERFFAGGATSVRGYRQDDLGPRSLFADASGGRALVIGNGELRFPLHRWLKGVGFVDVGNVYETVSELSLLNLQAGTGLGIRLNTPVGLLRFDVAVPVNRRPFDPKWATYFGLGHAF